MFGITAGNTSPWPHFWGTQTPPDVHGGQARGTGGRGVHAAASAQPLPQGPPPHGNRLSPFFDAVKVPAIRHLTQALWVVAAVAPTVALTFVPAAVYFYPALAAPRLAVWVGVGLLVTMALCLYTLARLDRWSSGRPSDADLAAAVAEALAAAHDPNVPTLDGPRGATHFRLRQPPHLQAAAGDTSHSATSSLTADRLKHDTVEIEGLQRGMRTFMPCAAYPRAKPEAYARVPLREVALLGPDGMTYNEVVQQNRGNHTDVHVFTGMDQFVIYTYDLYARRAFGEGLGGVFVGGWPDPSSRFGMLGAEMGLAHAGLDAGARISSNVSARRSKSHDVCDNRLTGAGAIFEDAVARDGYAVEKRDGQFHGWASTPSVRWSQGLFTPLRSFWRQDKRMEKKSDVVLATTVDEAAHFAALRAGHEVADGHDPFVARGWEHPEALRIRDSLGEMSQQFRGSLKTFNLFSAYLGHYAMAHHLCSLNVSCNQPPSLAGGKKRPWPVLEVTFTLRRQDGRRWLAALVGGLGADRGARTFEDKRYSTTVNGDLALAERLHPLLQVLRSSEDRKQQRKAWQEFVGQGAVRRAVSRGVVWGSQAGYDGLPVGHSYLSMLPGFLQLKMPDGFGEGWVPWQRGGAEIATTVYAPRVYAPQQANQGKQVDQVVRGSWRQPAGSINGPAGSRTPHVTSELSWDKDAQPTLQIYSRWSMSHADAQEVNDYIVAPLRQVLGLARQAPAAPEADNFLCTDGWKRSKIAHWRVSREVRLESRFLATQLQSLSEVTQAQWHNVVGWPPGCSAANGVDLSKALQNAFKQLPKGEAWQALGQNKQIPARTPMLPSTGWEQLGDAVAAFVERVQLAAPSLLRQAVETQATDDEATTGGWQLTTQSSAYNRPVQYLKHFRCEAKKVSVRNDAKAWAKFVREVRDEEAETQAGILLAGCDPFLLPADRRAHQKKLQEVKGDLENLRSMRAPAP